MRLRDPLELLEHAGRLHRQFFQLGYHSNRYPSWEPPVDIFETEQELIILVALPGVPAELLEIFIDGAAVIIRGQRTLPAACKNAAIRRLEIPYGRFERRIELPSEQFQPGQRLLQDGCLELILNKLE